MWTSEQASVQEYKYSYLMIKESNLCKRIWDFYAMACVIYVALVVPFRLGFDLDDTFEI